MLWFEQSIGWITALKFYAVSRVCLDPPPSHLLKRIIKPTRETSAVAAIQWGIKNESAACEMYVEQVMEAHVNLSYEPAGLYVNPCSPHLGASPDGHISCDCCGEGLIEIKCTCMYKYHQVSTWSNLKPGICSWIAITSITTRSKVNWPCVRVNTVTLYAGPQKDYL